jgi:hypothetical protein
MLSLGLKVIMYFNFRLAKPDPRLRVSGFALTASFHQYSILIFTLMLVLLDGQTGEAWGTSKQNIFHPDVW